MEKGEHELNVAEKAEACSSTTTSLYQSVPFRHSRSQDIFQAVAQMRASEASFSTTSTYQIPARWTMHQDLPKTPESVYTPAGWRTPSPENTYDDDRSKECSTHEPESPILPETPSTPSGPPPPIGPAFSKLHDIAFIINTCLAQFLSLAALAQTVAPLLIIGNDLNVNDPGTLSWFTAAFSLTLGTLILPSGRLGDMYGHKKIFMIGWAWLCVWSIICGFSYASGHTMLSICRAFQGIGPALTVPNAMALIARTYPVGMKRSIILSCFGASGPTGFVFGALLSSLFAQLACKFIAL